MTAIGSSKLCQQQIDLHSSGGMGCRAETGGLPMFDEYGFPGGTDVDDGSPMLCTFVYCSRAAEGVDDTEVDRIVEAAQRRNLALDVTGVLVFGNGVFFQLIEGPFDQIQKLIATLHRDPRHYDVVSLDWSKERRERLYPNWEMERVKADDIRAVLNDALESSKDEDNVAALMRILEHLASGPLDSLGRSS
jgi:hypothetical protein